MILPVSNLSVNRIKARPLVFKGKNSSYIPLSELDSIQIAAHSSKKGQIVLEGNKVFNRHATCMFREDINWKSFASYLSKRFSNCNKVNTYVYACSDGSEPYTLSMTLKYKLGDTAQKFYPIHAKDIDEKMIASNVYWQNDRHSYPMETERSIRNLFVKNFGSDNSNFALFSFEKDKNTKMQIEDMKVRKICDEPGFLDNTLKSVEFSCANIIEDVDNIDTSAPCLVMCRNMWPYVEPKEYFKFAKRLYNKLPKGSVVVIGSYDYSGEIGRKKSDTFPKALFKAGFVPIKSYKNFLQKGTSLIFEKNR